MNEKNITPNDMYKLLINNKNKGMVTEEYFITDYLIELRCDNNELFKIAYNLYPDEIRKMRIQQAIIEKKEIDRVFDNKINYLINDNGEEVLNGIMFMDTGHDNNEFIDKIILTYRQIHYSSKDIFKQLETDEKGRYRLFMACAQ